ncbi:Eco57I restriction-modification methylase domain-containing protein [Actinomadura litoris]|uniref:site-specific DNA-methyltransferase (adenine-specific) n=1 Tax=Actinomadura litoris TaxID=2678616 RepID=A0A7K1KWY3_9ACTN|nr:DNA methyltransferase [Actinomadura litoris]MUN36466.1 N-6 DNA methylase [Actinomadura litoris]
MSGSPYTAVHIEGGLLSADLIELIRSGTRELPGNRPEDYHLAAGERIGEAASRKWDYLKGAYRAFRERLDALPPTDSAVTETRERWLLRLFDELGFGRLAYVRGGIAAGEKTYPVSHQWGEHVAVHLLGWHTDLDRRTKAHGQTGRAPQSMLQEFLNVSDAHLWGVLSNGRVLRILRDSSALVGSAYVQFDLETIFDGDLYPEFVQLFALLHSSRFELLPRDDGGDPTVADCWLERWRAHGIETGSRAREQLRLNVERALNELGTGFLEVNQKLRDDLANARLTRQDYRHELLRLAYQLIFLFVAEGRKALLVQDPPDATPEQRAELQAARDRYTDYFSVERLRRISSRRRGDRHKDLWRTLVVVLDSLGTDDGHPKLGLPALGGLFFRAGDPLNDAGLAPDLLRTCELTNERLLSAIRLLTTFKDKKGSAHRVDYQHLGAEELGSVYESLLELEPQIDNAEPRFWLENLRGNQRKTTGSYYTPTALIDELLKTTLDPIIEEYAQSGNPDDLLKITVCDPACGSGHFLVAAARRIARKYAIMWSGDDEPTPAAVREAMHKVVERCVYGVDLNPMAAELAKFSLWLESQEPGRPLAFLDSHIKVGNSLLGTTPKLLIQGIPDEAFKPIGDDDKKIAKRFRTENTKERDRQLALQGDGLFELIRPPEDTSELTRQATALNRMRVGSIADIREQARRFRALLDSPDLANRKRLADAWCAAFVFPKQKKPRPITSATLQIMGGDDVAKTDFAQATPTAEMEDELDKLIEQYGFFHWHLEFPEIFLVGNDSTPDANHDTGWQGGFTCVLGNPPWERVKLQEQEFFDSRNDKIAKARNAAARKRLIEQLKMSEEPTDRALYDDFQEELRKSAGWSHLLRSSGLYPLTGRGDVNTYSVFAETARTIVGPHGRSGLVLPTGIATDATTAPFFSELVQSQALIHVLGFRNNRGLFQGVGHGDVRFCLIAFGGRKVTVEYFMLAFDLGLPSELKDMGRTYRLTKRDVELVNPNTRNCPTFKLPRDARIVRNIYERLPTLWRERPGGNIWNLSFVRMFDMASDSSSFATFNQLTAEGWSLEGNIATRENERMLPLYEGKMVYHYDHRFGDYRERGAERIDSVLPRVSDANKMNSRFSVLPRYWISEKEVEDRLAGRWDKKWLLGWRDIARSTDERTAIFGILPRSGVGHTFPVALVYSEKVACLYANVTSLVFDYVLRQKMGGTHLTYGYLKQLPVIAPGAYDASVTWEVDTRLREWLEVRVLELTYVAWELKAFACELGDQGAPFMWNNDRRMVLRSELDAAYFILYGVDRQDAESILDSFDVLRRNDPERFARTKALILDVYDAMARAMETGKPYKTILDPPPGEGPRHPER